MGPAQEVAMESFLQDKNLESVFLYSVDNQNLKYLRTAGRPNDHAPAIPSELGWGWSSFNEETPTVGQIFNGTIPVAGLVKNKAGTTMAYIALVKIDAQALMGQSKDFQNFVFDSQGMTLVPHTGNELTSFWDSAVNQLFSGKFLTGVQEIEINHKTFIVGYRRLYQSKLMVTSFVLKDLAFTSIKLLMIRSLLLGISILLLAAGLCVFMVKGLTTRLSELYEASSRITEGDYSSRVSVKSIIGDEVVSLAHSFNTMSDKIIQTMAELEDYAKNLEKKVNTRTAELRAANHLLEALLNSLGQGFLIFDKDGNCLPIYSKICEKVLETIPAQKKIWQVLKLSTEQTHEFKDWSALVFDEVLPFEDLATLGPNLFIHSKGKRIELEYFLMRDNDKGKTAGKIKGVVLVATDRTSEFEAKISAGKEHDYGLMIVRLVKYKEQFMSLIRDSHEFLGQIRRIINTETLSASEFESILRWLHTMKGGSAAFLMSDIVQIIHESESKLMAIKDQPLPEVQKSLLNFKPDVDQIESEFRNFFSKNQEVIGRNIEDIEKRLEIKVTEFVQLCNDIVKLPGGEELEKRLKKQFFMEPIGKSLVHYDDVIQRIADDLGKKLKPLVIQGGETQVLIEKYSELFSSFIHAFRNSVDHGIETPDERERAGKDPAGIIEINISKTEKNGLAWIRIEKKDDGRGIDPGLIRTKMLEKGIPSAQDLSDHEVIQYVFESGFSTRSEVTDLSGRGLGMDAIRSAAQENGGSAVIFSEVGKGTSLIVEFPDSANS